MKMSIVALYVFYSITILVVGLLIKKSALRVTLVGFGGFFVFLIHHHLDVWRKLHLLRFQLFQLLIKYS